MRKEILAIVTSAALFSATSVFAQTSSNSNLEETVQQLMRQTQALQEEVRTLRAELHQGKHKSYKEQKQLVTNKKTVVASSGKSKAKIKASSQANVPNEEIVRGMPDLAMTDEELENEEKVDFITRMIGSPVLTSPVLSLRKNSDAGDLIVNYSTMNEDLRFLREKKALADLIGVENLPSAYRPLLILSGKVETQFAFQDPFAGPSNSAIDLSGVELDAYAQVSPWASGFISLQYDNSTFDPTLLGSGDPNNNGKLYVNRGFLTIGNLSKSPLYFTGGLMYLPFGRYSSYMLSNPLTKSVGRINQPGLLLGYATDDVFVSAYGYDGPSNFGQSNIDGVGANAGYMFSLAGIDFQAGAGVVDNMADTQNAQSTGGSGFTGFSASSATETIRHAVPGANLNLSASKGPFTLVGEYVGATRSYAAEDLSFNGAGASPEAIHAELDYVFKIIEKPASVALSYGQTWDALGLNLPQNSYTATFNVSVWKNTIETLEFRHDVNYPGTDTAGGICPAVGGGTTFCAVPSVGSVQNTLLAQIGIYF